MLAPLTYVRRFVIDRESLNRGLVFQLFRSDGETVRGELKTRPRSKRITFVGCPPPAEITAH